MTNPCKGLSIGRKSPFKLSELGRMKVEFSRQIAVLMSSLKNSANWLGAATNKNGRHRKAR